VDEGETVDVVFLDFRKAFGTVAHSTLLDKLSNCGMSAFTVRWVRSWLKGRAQRVVGSEWGYVWLVTGHQWRSSGLISRASSVQYS